MVKRWLSMGRNVGSNPIIHAKALLGNPYIKYLRIVYIDKYQYPLRMD